MRNDKLKKGVKHVLVGFFVLASLTDLVTAITGANNFRETNPLYVMMESWWLLIIFKLLITFYLAKQAYPKKGFSTERSYYFIILLLLFGGIVYSMGAYSNIEVGHVNVEYYANLPEPTVEQKTSHYNTFALTFFAIPLFIALVPYMIFEWTLPYQKIKKRRI